MSSPDSWCSRKAGLGPEIGTLERGPALSYPSGTPHQAHVRRFAQLAGADCCVARCIPLPVAAKPQKASQHVVEPTFIVASLRYDKRSARTVWGLRLGAVVAIPLHNQPSQTLCHSTPRTEGAARNAFRAPGVARRHDSSSSSSLHRLCFPQRAARNWVGIERRRIWDIRNARFVSRTQARNTRLAERNRSIAYCARDCAVIRFVYPGTGVGDRTQDRYSSTAFPSLGLRNIGLTGHS